MPDELICVLVIGSFNVEIEKESSNRLDQTQNPDNPGLGQYIDDTLVGQVHSMQLARR